MILTVNFLGSPDNGPIVTGYLGSFLMAGSYLAIASFTSALTKNQVISFILSVSICLVLVLLGWGVLSESLNTIFPVWISDFVSQFSFTTHFDAIRRGVVDLRDLIYFVSIIVIMLMLNVVVLESHKAS
jgi:ABC-2 type transport system permease protein